MFTGKRPSSWGNAPIRLQKIPMNSSVSSSPDYDTDAVCWAPADTEALDVRIQYAAGDAMRAECASKFRNAGRWFAGLHIRRKDDKHETLCRMRDRISRAFVPGRRHCERSLAIHPLQFANDNGADLFMAEFITVNSDVGIMQV